MTKNLTQDLTRVSCNKNVTNIRYLIKMTKKPLRFCAVPVLICTINHSYEFSRVL